MLFLLIHSEKGGLFLLASADVRRQTLCLGIPGVLSMLASSFSTLLEALMLSRENTALSCAVGVSFSLVTLIQTIGFTLATGAGSFVSRCLGRSAEQDAHVAASTALFLSLLLSIVFMVIGLFFTQPLLRLLGASSDTAASGATYARYVLLTAPILCPALVASGLLRAKGKMVPNMIAYLVGSAVGIMLLFLLVSRLHLGIHGAGLSMLVREGTTLFLLLHSLKIGHLRDISFRPRVFQNIMASGLPTLLRQAVISLSSVLLFHVCAAFGTSVSAGMGLAVRAAALVSSAVIGLGQGLQPVCGFQYGAGRLSLCRSAYVFCQKIALLSLIPVSLAFFLFSQTLLAPFAPDAEALHIAASSLRAQSVVFLAQGAVTLMSIVSQSIGFTARASLVSVSRQGIFCVLILLCRNFGLPGLILCQSISDLLALLFSYMMTKSLFKRDHPTNFSSSRFSHSDVR